MPSSCPFVIFLFVLGALPPARSAGLAEGQVDPLLSQQWLFVDQSGPDADPWRFYFEQREPDTHLLKLPRSGIYRDTLQGAELRCRKVAPDEMEVLNGCELHWNDEVLFAAGIQDLGLHRIRAFRGQLQANSMILSYYRHFRNLQP